MKMRLEEVESNMDQMLTQFTNLLDYNKNCYLEMLKMREDYEKGIELLMLFIFGVMGGNNPNNPTAGKAGKAYNSKNRAAKPDSKESEPSSDTSAVDPKQFEKVTSCLTQNLYQLVGVNFSDKSNNQQSPLSGANSEQFFNYFLNYLQRNDKFGSS